MLSAKDEKTCIACPLPFCLKACYTTFIIEKYALEGEIPMIYESSASSRCAAGPKIAAIGGGTGLSTMLRGLKKYTDRLTAIVTVADDGGGSGVLRREMGILPPGDVRQCMQALANTEPVMEQLLGYRFPEGQLKGQSFGNLLLAALNGMAGSFEEAVAMMGQVLAISGRVLPVTNADVQLEAVFENGARVVGESHIFNAKKQQDCRIHHVSLVPEHPKALPDALHAISEADLILLGPGSLYTSVIPNLLVDGVADTIRASHAQKFYICNIMTQDGETEGYTAADHLEALQRHGREGIVDLCLATMRPSRAGSPRDTVKRTRSCCASTASASRSWESRSRNTRCSRRRAATPAMTRRCWRRRSWSSTASARCASTAAPSSTLRKNRSGNNAQQ